MLKNQFKVPARHCFWGKLDFRIQKQNNETFITAINKENSIVFLVSALKSVEGATY